MLRRRSCEERIFTPAKVGIYPAARADYLPEFTRVVGGDLALDRRTNTVGVQLFAGAKVTQTFACEALLDTGGPAIYTHETVLKQVLTRGAVSEGGARTGHTLQWRGFIGIPLKTSCRVRLYVSL